MDGITRTKVGAWEKVHAYTSFALIGIGPLTNSLLEDAGVESFWMRILLLIVFILTVIGLLTFPAVRAGRRRLAADRENGVFPCAVRFPLSIPGSLRDLWDDGVAQIGDGGLVFQPQQGQFQTKPAGTTRTFGDFDVLGIAELTGKKPRVWSRGWSIRELQTDAGKIHLAASSKSWALIDERSSREPHGAQ